MFQLGEAEKMIKGQLLAHSCGEVGDTLLWPLSMITLIISVCIVGEIIWPVFHFILVRGELW